MTVLLHSALPLGATRFQSVRGRLRHWRDAARHSSASLVDGERGGEQVSVITERPWNVIVGNDPVTPMTVVVVVFRRIFGYSNNKCTHLMLTVTMRAGPSLVGQAGAGRVVLRETPGRGAPLHGGAGLLNVAQALRATTRRPH